MDPKYLSLIIKTLLLKPLPRTYMAPPPSAGFSTVPQPSDCELDEETLAAMRDFIAERLGDNVNGIATALVELIRCNSQMPMNEALFELCDEAPETYRYAMTQQVTLVHPHLVSALTSILSPCIYPVTPPPAGDQSRNTMMSTIEHLSGSVTNVRIGIETLTQRILSSKIYSPFWILHNCNSKVVIVHDSPYKDKIRGIADEKNMIVLIDTSDADMKSESILPYSNHFRPELGLLLMINAYNLTGGARLFPGRNKNSVYAVHEWTSIDNYVALEKYINDTDGIRAELERKAPEFLKDFDEDLAVIHRDWVNN